MDCAKAHRALGTAVDKGRHHDPSQVGWARAEAPAARDSDLRRGSRRCLVDSRGQRRLARSSRAMFAPLQFRRLRYMATNSPRSRLPAAGSSAPVQASSQARQSDRGPQPLGNRWRPCPGCCRSHRKRAAAASRIPRCRSQAVPTSSPPQARRSTRHSPRTRASQG